MEPAAFGSSGPSCLSSFQEPQEEDDDYEEEDEVETTPNPPMMVPMADMLNHVANHNANLEFTPVRPTLSAGSHRSTRQNEKNSLFLSLSLSLPHPPILLSQDCLKMVCVRPVSRGQEVFNTYGQMANWQLLHMYGFAEPYHSNSNDTADVPAANLYHVAKQGDP